MKWIRLPVGLVVVAGLLGVGGRAAIGSSSDPQIDRVVFVTIDCLRADHLSSFGYPVPTTPFLDSLAERGTSFGRAYAHSATTGPSHASMFTSLYPIQHGVMTNGHVLHQRFVTLAERMNELGFVTSAWVSGNPHFGESQIAQGFSYYDQPEQIEKSSGKTKFLYRPGGETTDRVIDWLDGVDADDKLFLWVHYYDPHRDYRPPESFLEKATPPNRKARTAFKDFILEEHHLDLTNTPRLSKVIRQTIQYDAEVMYADASIQQLFEAFSQRDLDDNTLWVITADHGQGLWNHGNPGHHWQVYNTLLHVPLVFYYSGGSLAAGRIDDRLVEHVDIPITILDLLGAKLGEQAAEVQGESLAPLLHSRPMPSSSNYAFSVRRAPLRKDSGSDKPLAKKESGEKYALQDFRHKYIWWSDGPNEFFDLAADPYETHNLVAQPSADRDRLEAMLLDTVQRLASSKEAGVVSEQTLRGLEALGYTD